MPGCFTEECAKELAELLREREIGVEDFLNWVQEERQKALKDEDVLKKE